MERSGDLTGGMTDRLGALASGLCAIHCAACALLPAAFGALGLGFLLGHEAEWIFTLTAVAFATGASLLGWRRYRAWLPLICLLLGVAGLFISRSLESAGAEGASHAHAAAHHHADEAEADHEGGHALGAGIGVLAGLLILSGHLLNLRASRASACGEGCCEGGRA